MRIFLLPGLLALLILSLTRAWGGRAALWCGWPIGMLLVCSGATRIPVKGGFTLNSQTTTVLCILVALVMGAARGPRSRLRWSAADLLVGVMATLQYASTHMNGRAGYLTWLTVLCHSVFPYIIGRYYLRSWDDLGNALRPFAVCIVALSASMVLESLSGINLLLILSGRRWHAHERLFIYRAWGVLQPIKMGLVLVTLLPWAMEAARRARAGTGPKWWLGLPWVLGAAVCSTVSRAAVGAMVVTWGIYTYYRRPKWRKPLILFAVASLCMVLFGYDHLRSALFAVSGENKIETTRYVTIDNEEYVYTGSDHRWLLFKVYAEPLRNAGLLGFGYGTYGNADAEETEEAIVVQGSFFSIDNNIVVWILTYGYLGLALFLLLYFIPVPGLIRVASDQRNNFAPFAGGVLGAATAFQLALVTVALMRDYEMFLMFMMGIAVSVTQLGAHSRHADAASPQQPPPPPPHENGWYWKQG